jgi:hypothetical protein
MSDPFADLPRGHFKAIYADPPWAYKTYSGDAIPARASRNGLATAHYQTMPIAEALARAESADPALKLDRSHNLAKQRAEREFARLFDEWVKG